MTPPWIRGARAAAIFLTRIPVGGFPFSRDDWRWSSAYFPLVGLGLGILQAAWFALFFRAGGFVAALMTVGASLMLTGAFHEDGFADTADALGGAYTREKIFEILKDSRVGVFGASALVWALTLRAALLARLAIAPTPEFTSAVVPVVLAALVVTPCVSRVFPIWLMAAMPYVTGEPDAKSRTVARAGIPQLIVATMTGLFVLVCACGLHLFKASELVAMAALAGASSLVCAWRFRARTGGITGDFLGATQQVAELAMLLALALMRGAQP